MFTGLSAFPLTPMNETNVNEQEFVGLIKRLTSAKVDSIGILGSTGSYAYLSLEERMKVASLAVEHAEETPIIIGIGSLRTKDVLRLAENSEKIGATAVLLAPISYQPLTESEVYNLFQTVNNSISLPICVYDNPGTTHFKFSDDLLGRISHLNNVKSIKIPPVSSSLKAAQDRINKLRSLIANDVTIGISGDASAATGLIAGCDLWYSVIGGLFPNTALRLVEFAKQGKNDIALEYSENLEVLWNLFRKYGSLRVIAAAAEIDKLASFPSLPLPLQSLQGEDRKLLAGLIELLDLY